MFQKHQDRHGNFSLVLSTIFPWPLDLYSLLRLPLSRFWCFGFFIFQNLKISGPIWWGHFLNCPSTTYLHTKDWQHRSCNHDFKTYGEEYKSSSHTRGMKIDFSVPLGAKGNGYKILRERDSTFKSVSVMRTWPIDLICLQKEHPTQINPSASHTQPHPATIFPILHSLIFLSINL